MLKLTSSSSAKCPDIVPPLYEPVLSIVDFEHFKLRGFERLGIGDDTFIVLQEWYCPVGDAGRYTHSNCE